MKNISKIFCSYIAIIVIHISVVLFTVIKLPPRSFLKNGIGIATLILGIVICNLIGKHWKKTMDISRRENIIMVILIVISIIISTVFFKKDSFNTFMLKMCVIYFHTIYIFVLFIASHKK